MSFQIYEANLDQNRKAKFPGKVILSGLSLEQACVMIECLSRDDDNRYWYMKRCSMPRQELSGTSKKKAIN